jgi:protein SCO1/2
VRRALLVAALVVGCAGCGGSAHKASPPPRVASQGDGFVLHPPVAAPPFALGDQAGRPTGPQQDRGHWTVVTFLYTRCPGVCPLIAQQLGAAQRRNADLRVIAVSVDPKHDTAAARRKFLAARGLGPRFRFVSGTRAALQPVWARYHIAALPGPSGTVSHSSYEILIDPKGRERVLFDAKVTARAVLRAIASMT